MPTSQKRVQVLFRPAVLEVLEQLANEQGVTLSKISAQLVEEALESRGLVDRKTLADQSRKMTAYISHHKKIKGNEKKELLKKALLELLSDE